MPDSPNQLPDPWGFTLLRNHTFLKVSGKDAERFLNGQLTNDLKSATADALLSCCCVDAKGRLNAILNVRTLPAPHAFLLDAPSGLRESLAARLDRYIIADDVELCDVSDTFALLHVLADEPQALSPASMIFQAPSIRFAPNGWDIVVPRQQLDPFADMLRARLPEIDGTALDLLRVHNAIPAWGAELNETTLPAEAGLDRHAVSFDKGCYIGQEVISRIRSIGHPARRLAKFHVESGDPAPGNQLRRADSEENPEVRAAGILTSVAAQSNGLPACALGYLKWAVDASRFAAFNDDGRKTAVLALQQPPFHP